MLLDEQGHWLVKNFVDEVYQAVWSYQSLSLFDEYNKARSLSDVYTHVHTNTSYSEYIIPRIHKN